MKAWLKWGLIFVGIYITFLILAFSYMEFLKITDSPIGFAPGIFTLLPAMIIPPIGNCFLGGFGPNPGPDCNGTIVLILTYALNILFYFLLGAFIGKLKSKKNETQPQSKKRYWIFGGVIGGIILPILGWLFLGTISLFILFFIGFILGALIGLIISKLKQKKENSLKN